MKRRCPTCPFNPSGKGYTCVRPLLEQRALGQGTPICHSTGPGALSEKPVHAEPHACRGARDLQLAVFAGLGFISAATDEAWAAKFAEIERTAKPRRYQSVFVRWSASYVYEVRFLGWRRTRCIKSGKLGVGAKVDSTWLFAAEIVGAIPSGCKRGQFILRPHTPIYATYDDAKAGRNPLPRPAVSDIKPRRK